MNKNDSDRKDDCQLQFVYEAGEKPTLADRARNIGLRVLSALLRRFGSRAYAGGNDLSSGPGVGISEEIPRESDTESSAEVKLKPGDVVRIRSLKEIQMTLDNNGRCAGLQFMLGMQKYCGQEARVLKRVLTIFDERLWKMVKIRDAYLLENVTCNGRDVFDGEGCDRTCYYFWKSRWLQRIP